MSKKTKEMTNEEYYSFLNTIDALPKMYHSIIKTGVLQLNEDKKQLVEIINDMIKKEKKAFTLLQMLHHYFQEGDPIHNDIEEVQKLLCWSDEV